MVVDLGEVWRDKGLLEEIKSEIKRQSFQEWRPWEILLPPKLLWPMLEEVSQGMFQEWSPTLLGIGVQVGTPEEIAIKFVLPKLATSPVMVKSMPYIPNRTCDYIPVEVNSHGN